MEKTTRSTAAACCGAPRGVLVVWRAWCCVPSLPRPRRRRAAGSRVAQVGAVVSVIAQRTCVTARAVSVFLSAVDRRQPTTGRRQMCRPSHARATSPSRATSSPGDVTAGTPAATAAGAVGDADAGSVVIGIVVYVCHYCAVPTMPHPACEGVGRRGA